VTAVSCVRSPIPSCSPRSRSGPVVRADDGGVYGRARPVGESLRDSPERRADLPAQVAAIRSAQKTFTYAQYVYENGPSRAGPHQGHERALPGGRPWSRAGRWDRLAGHAGRVAGTLVQPGASSRSSGPWICDDLRRQRSESSPHPRRRPDASGSPELRRQLEVDGQWAPRGYWRQTDVRIEGHAVTDLQAAFA